MWNMLWIAGEAIAHLCSWGLALHAASQARQSNGLLRAAHQKKEGFLQALEAKKMELQQYETMQNHTQGIKKILEDVQKKLEGREASDLGSMLRQSENILDRYFLLLCFKDILLANRKKLLNHLRGSYTPSARRRITNPIILPSGTYDAQMVALLYDHEPFPSDPITQEILPSRSLLRTDHNFLLLIDFLEKLGLLPLCDAAIARGDFELYAEDIEHFVDQIIEENRVYRESGRINNPHTSSKNKP